MSELGKVAIGLEYDGTRYAGWQQQKNALAVQVVVEEAISVVAAAPTKTVCAGRTDSGVHALGQVVSFSCENERSSKAWIRGCNSNLPADVRVLWVREATADFSARFSATQRHYRYLIYNRPVASAISTLRMVHQPRALDVEKMQHKESWNDESDQRQGIIETRSEQFVPAILKLLQKTDKANRTPRKTTSPVDFSALRYDQLCSSGWWNLLPTVSIAAELLIVIQFRQPLAYRLHVAHLIATPHGSHSTYPKKALIHGRKTQSSTRKTPFRT